MRAYTEWKKAIVPKTGKMSIDDILRFNSDWPKNRPIRKEERLMKTQDRKIKDVEFGIWDTHVEDLLHDFGCHRNLAVVLQHLADMEITDDAVRYLRYEIAVFVVHVDQGDDEVTNISSFRADPKYLRFLEGK